MRHLHRKSGGRNNGRSITGHYAGNRDVIDKVKDEELQAVMQNLTRAGEYLLQERAVPVFLQEDLPCV